MLQKNMKNVKIKAVKPYVTKYPQNSNSRVLQNYLFDEFLNYWSFFFFIFKEAVHVKI